MEKNNKVGRPKEGIESLPKGWKDEILYRYEEGAADIEIQALIHSWRGSFSKDLWGRWMKEEEEFSDTIKLGRMYSEAWWTSTGRTNLRQRDFSYVGWYMNMKNRFGWKDRADITTNEQSINVISLGNGVRPPSEDEE